MAYDSVRIVAGDPCCCDSIAVKAVARFDRRERIAVLVGGLAAGTLVGCGLAFALGHLRLPVVALIGAPVFVLALHLASFTLTEAMRERASGCALATILYGAALLAWPMAALLVPLSPLNFWAAPVLAIAALVMFASCWQGPARAVYRLAAMGNLTAILAVHHGTMFVMGA